MRYPTGYMSTTYLAEDICAHCDTAGEQEITEDRGFSGFICDTCGNETSWRTSEQHVRELEFTL